MKLDKNNNLKSLTPHEATILKNLSSRAKWLCMEMDCPKSKRDGKVYCSECPFQALFKQCGQISAAIHAILQKTPTEKRR